MAKVNRRHFLEAVSVGGALASVGSGAPKAVSLVSSLQEKPALLGGRPLRTKAFPGWPVIEDGDLKRWGEVFEKGLWNRGPEVQRFEDDWARLLGAKYAVATASGTAALMASLAALEVGPGDEVIVPPYTFVATINVVLMHYALPVFVDTDRATFQIDPAKIAGALTDKTRCIVPVHLGGNVADMDRILDVANQKRIPVLEDACQAHLAEWKKRKVGTLGRLGCFSFQASKNLNSGEGGAIVSNDDELAQLAASFHNAGRPYTTAKGKLEVDTDSSFSYARNGDNRRLTEFQGLLLCEQLERLEAQSRTREQNAAYLTSQLKQIPGLAPAEQYPGCTRNAYHLYMFRYRPEQFSGLTRDRFIDAMEAEGVPCSSGYSPLNREAFLEKVLRSRGFRRIYGEAEINRWVERNACPENDQLCREAVWLTQTQLLGPRSDMDEIAAAIRKIQRFSADLKK